MSEGRRGAAFGQAAPRRDQAGHRADQLVRAHPQSGLGQPQLAMHSLYLVTVQMHRCERDARGGGTCSASPSLPSSVASRPPGQLARLGSAVRSEPPRARDTPGSQRARTRLSGARGSDDARLEGGDRLIETARPQFGGSAAREHLRPDPGMPCQQAFRELLQQGRRAGGRGGRGIEIPGATRQRQPDQRRAEPGRDFAVRRKGAEDALRRGERGTRTARLRRRTAPSPPITSSGCGCVRTRSSGMRGTPRRAIDCPVGR